MKLLKIVIVVEEFDCTQGYLEYHLAKELVKLGNDVYVFTFGNNGKNFRTQNLDGFRVYRLPAFFSFNIAGYHLPNPSSLGHIMDFLSSEHPDIVHCQPIDSPLSLIFIALSGFFKYKIVGPIMTQLNLVFSPWNMKQRFLFCISKIIVSRYAAKRSNFIFSKSKALMKILSKSYNVSETKFRVIPLGTDPVLFKFNINARLAVRKNLLVSPKDVLIVYSGKINPTKGIELLLKASSKILNQNNTVKLLLIGSGQPAYLEKLKKFVAEHGMKTHVIFQPWVRRNQLPDFYSASDIAVWPGLSSISIVDAAAVSLPLVVANSPVEIFAVENHNGFVFELGDVEELTICLKRLIDSEALRKEMGSRSRFLVETKLNWRSISQQYLTAYTYALMCSSS